MGYTLVVSVTRDRSVNKGPGRPTNKQAHRIALVRALRYVDEAILVDDPIEAFKRVHPNIFVKGQDYKQTIRPIDREYCDAHGIEIRFTNTPMYSATKIINDRFRNS